MSLGATAIGDWFARHRALAGKFAFELAIVFVGVTAAFALENLREHHEEVKYRQSMIAALSTTFEDVAHHGRDIDRTITQKLVAFDAARARGERPPPPIYREDGAERPPTRVWEAVVQTGAAKALKPEMFFRLVSFYNFMDSFGDRYIRYTDFTESRVLPAVGDPAAFYDPRSGKMRPEFAAYVDRLRDLQALNREMIVRAARLSDELKQER
jgi:hypothetical protein